jgi:hypothetical protein
VGLVELLTNVCRSIGVEALQRRDIGSQRDIVSRC